MEHYSYSTTKLFLPPDQIITSTFIV